MDHIARSSDWITTERTKDIVSGKLGFTEHHRDRSPESNLRPSAVESFPVVCAFCAFLRLFRFVFPLRLCVFA